MKKVLKYLFLGALGGCIYYMIEILWRGYSDWRMIIVGGTCFVICGSLNEIFDWDMLMWKQMLISSLLITIAEFIAGYVFNIILGLDIWDYSNMPLNIAGQVCLTYTVLWFLLSAVAIILDDYLRYWFFKEEKPRYRWR